MSMAQRLRDENERLRSDKAKILAMLARVVDAPCMEDESDLKEEALDLLSEMSCYYDIQEVRNDNGLL